MFMINPMLLNPNTKGSSQSFGLNLSKLPIKIWLERGFMHPMFLIVLANIGFLLVVVDVLRACRQSENPESNMRVDCFDFINGTFVRRPGANCQVKT